MDIKNAIDIYHHLAEIIGSGKSRVLLKTLILTGRDFMSKSDLNYRSSAQNQKKFCTTEENDYVFHKAETYHMKVTESILSAESFDHLRYMICTNRKATLIDLPPTSAMIHAALWRTLYLSIFVSVKKNIKIVL